MELYYDDKLYHPYVCVKDFSENDLKRIVDTLKTSSFEPSKFYISPRYPASNGIFYDYIFRIPFKNDKTKSKPTREEIEVIFKKFMAKDFEETHANESKPHEQPNLKNFLKSEKEYLTQINALLSSERKILERDKDFFKKQIDKLNSLVLKLQNENTSLLRSFDELSGRLTKEISNLSQSGISENENNLRLQKVLKEQEVVLKNKESVLLKKEKDLEERLKENQHIKEEYEKEFILRVNELRAEMLGISGTDEAISPKTIGEIKILCFGESYVTRNEIKEIFNSVFFRNFDHELPSKSLEIKSLDYEKVKSLNIPELIQKDKYDYIIAGARPHSTTNKKLNQSLISLTREMKLKAKVFDTPSEALNKTTLTELAGNIANDWYGKKVA